MMPFQRAQTGRLQQVVGHIRGPGQGQGNRRRPPGTTPGADRACRSTPAQLEQPGPVACSSEAPAAVRAALGQTFGSSEGDLAVAALASKNHDACAIDEHAVMVGRCTLSSWSISAFWADIQPSEVVAAADIANLLPLLYNQLEYSQFIY